MFSSIHSHGHWGKNISILPDDCSHPSLSTWHQTLFPTPPSHVCAECSHRKGLPAFPSHSSLLYSDLNSLFNCLKCIAEHWSSNDTSLRCPEWSPKSLAWNRNSSWPSLSQPDRLDPRPSPSRSAHFSTSLNFSSRPGPVMVLTNQVFTSTDNRACDSALHGPQYCYFFPFSLNSHIRITHV